MSTFTCVNNFVGYCNPQVVDKIVGLRVPKDVEIEGPDGVLHGEKAYGER